MQNREGFIRDLRILVNNLRENHFAETTPWDEVAEAVGELLDAYGIEHGSIIRTDIDTALDFPDAEALCDLLEQVLWLASDDAS
jgi:hypothetical protein